MEQYNYKEVMRNDIWEYINNVLDEIYEEEEEEEEEEDYE